MKTIIRFAVCVLMVFFIFSCATTPTDDMTDTKDEGTKEEPVGDQSKDETGSGAREVERTIYLPSEVKIFFADGTLDRRTVTEYEEDSTRILSESVYDTLDSMVEQTVYEYTGNSVVVSTTDADGSLLRYMEMELDEDNRLIEERFFDDKQNIQNSSKYSYDEQGNLVSWIVLNETGLEISLTKYVYENGKRVRIENYSPGQKLEEYFILAYDGDQLKVEEFYFEDELESKTEYFYENGQEPSKVVYFNASNAIRRQELFSYENGVPVRIEVQGRTGDVRSISEIAYVTRTVIETIYE
jgi:YD repeat-containing protein